MTCVISTFAQNIPFVPPVYNYTTDLYHAGNQNWAVAQGANGVIYFGNDNGLLSYDGGNWELHNLPNNLSVKSIFIDATNEDERIYVGSFEEFGYFESNEINQLIYHSLSHNIEDHQFHNDEIWNIHPFKDKLYFQSFATIFVYDGQQISLLNPYPAVLYFFSAGEKMYAQLIDGGFCEFDGEKFHPINTQHLWKNDNVVSMLPYGEEWLLVTSKSGIFLFSDNKSILTPWPLATPDQIVMGTVNRAISLDNTYIFGTLNSGIIAIDQDGKQIWHIDRSNNLINNTVLALFEDRDRNLWAALDNGISNIRTNTPLSFFEPINDQIGPVEDILFHENTLYLATNQGVYSYTGNQTNLSRIPGFDIQSWFIKSVDNQIFVGHNEGTSRLHRFSETRVQGANTGGTDIQQVTINGNEILLESSYTSLYVYKRDNSANWVFSHALENFSDLIKNIEIDHAGNIWAGHMYKGLYRLKLDQDLKKVVETESYLSFDSTQVSTFRPIRVMKLRGRIVFSDGKNFYTYDDMAQQIIAYEHLNSDLPHFADTHRIVPMNDTLFWFIRNKEFVLVEFTANHFVIKDRIPYSIMNNPPNAGRANVIVSNDDITYLTMNGGIARYLLPQEKKAVTPDLHIESIVSHSRINDQSSYLSPSQNGVVSYENNNITAQFLYTEFSKKEFMVECYLQGYDNRWMYTDRNRSASYSNLAAGDYILYARVKDSSGKILSSTSYSFQILSPWYKTWWAILAYAIVLGSISLFLVKKHTQRIVRKKQQVFEEQETRRLAKIERQEMEITTLQNEKLEAELTYKGKELASAAMMLINHAEFIKSLRESVQSLILAGKVHRAEGNNLLSLIGKNVSGEDEWNLFQNNFDLIHENFFRNLKDRYPSLTPSDLKLCSLLRLNYSSKEIAEMLNISLRGVEAARYRLRKKLNLSEAENLVEFMIRFQ